MKHSIVTAPSMLLLLLVVMLTCADARAQEFQRRRQTVEHAGTQPAATPQRREAEVSFDALLDAESYAMYGEIRAVGQLLRSDDFTQSITSLEKWLGPTAKESKELKDFLFFFAMHAEALNDTSVMVCFLPTRDKLPEGLVAFQFPSVEAAVNFEPKLRAFLTRQSQFLSTLPSKPAAPTPPPSTGKQTTGNAKKQKPPQLPFYLRRTGNLLLAAEHSFTLRNLRGGGDALLADDGRFQAVRRRLSNEPLFVYFEVARLDRGFAQENEKRAEQEALTEKDREYNSKTETIAPTKTSPTLTTDNPVVVETRPRNESVLPQPEPTTDVMTEDPAPPEMNAEGNEGQDRVGGAETAPPTPDPSEMIIPMLFSRLLGGTPRWPDAVGVALDFNRSDFVIRAVLQSPPSERLSLIPFFPSFVSGPVSTLDASSIAPSETELFLSASIDWEQVYEAMLHAEGIPEPPPPVEGEPDAENKPPSIESSIEMFEKAAGFKIRENLLPALGNEVSVSAPLTWFEPSLGSGTKSAETPETKAGIVILLSLNNVEEMRKMLPRLLAVTGMKAPVESLRAEKRGDFEINSYGGFSCAFINNYLALAEDPAAIRHFIDTGQQTLNSNQSFRASTGWQPRQKLGQIYVSPALMESLLNAARKWFDPSDAELQALSAWLNVETLPATYAVTDEGSGAVLHELHLPRGILSILSAQTIINIKQAPLIQSESGAMYRLREIYNAQESYKESKGKGRYGTFEELTGGAAESASLRTFEKTELEQMPYKFEVSTTGDKFQATATPKEYGKTSRRSFFIDESGVLRGADHRGAAATDDDPPVD